jgi:hypothetical protein
MFKSKALFTAITFNIILSIVLLIEIINNAIHPAYSRVKSAHELISLIRQDQRHHIWDSAIENDKDWCNLSDKERAAIIRHNERLASR